MKNNNVSVVEMDLVGISPISFGKQLQSQRAQGEDHMAFEERVWRERMHVDEHGHVFIPPMALKRCLEATAKYLSESVPGKGKATFTKHMLAGTLVVDPLMLVTKNGKPIIAKDVQPERVFVNADGKKGSGTHVWRIFPFIPEWRTHAIVHVIDPVLKAHHNKISDYATHGGQFNGIGRFAPRTGGFYGRYTVENVTAN